jgi:hypothetical protein
MENLLSMVFFHKRARERKKLCVRFFISILPEITTSL